MSDEQILDLFAEGTAPDADPAFEGQVAAGIGRARLGMRLRALGLKAAAAAMLSGVAFLAAAAARPVLAQLTDGSPQFMGAPLPVVLVVLVVGVALIAGRSAWRPDAGAEPLELVE